MGFLKNIRREPLAAALALCFFLSAAANDEAFLLQVGSFFISPFDISFLLLLATFAFALASRSDIRFSYSSRAPLFFYVVSLATLLLGVIFSSNEFADRLRDMRVILYYLIPPFLFFLVRPSRKCLSFFNQVLVYAGVIISVLMFFSAFGGEDGEIQRNVRVAIWELPFAICALLLFKYDLPFSRFTRYVLVNMFVAAILISQNRSQYVQLVIALGLVACFLRGSGFTREVFSYLVPAFVITAGLLAAAGKLNVIVDRFFTMTALDDDSSLAARVAEADGQFSLFLDNPIFGNGLGFKSLVMGPFGFEYSTFAHNSWLFYLMKFGVLWTPFVLSAVFVSIFVGSVHLFNRKSIYFRYSVFYFANVPVYFLLDSMSAGLSYAPKSLFLSFLLTYGLLIGGGVMRREN